MKYDLNPVPSDNSSKFRPEYMEAKMVEDKRIISSIVENYEFNCITEHAALALIDIARMNDGESLSIINESVELCDQIELPVMTDMSFVGECVHPYKLLLKASDDSSFIKKSEEPTWLNNNNLVTNVGRDVLNEKTEEMKLFISSEGERGFDELTRYLYKEYPDERLDRIYIFEQVLAEKLLKGALTLEDAVAANSLVHHMFSETSVAAMAPVIGLTPSVPQPCNGSTEDMVAATDAEISAEEEEHEVPVVDPTAPEDEFPSPFESLESAMGYISSIATSNGSYTVLESVVYKNNVVFDSNVRKLFGKISQYLRLSNPDDLNDSMKNSLNVKKDRYSFTFADTSTNPDVIQAAIIGCGFKPIKENNIIMRYEKENKGLLITVEFTSIDAGLQVHYVNKENVVKESSSESLEEKLEKFSHHSDTGVKDAAKKALKLVRDKDADSSDVEKAVNAFNHILDNWKDVQKDKEVTERASVDILASLQNGRRQLFSIRDWANSLSGATLESSHELFEKPYEEVMRMKSDILAIESAMLKSTSEATAMARKLEIVNAINETYPGLVTEFTVDDYLVNLMSESPSRYLLDSCCNMLESVFDNYIDSVKFTESVSKFVIDLQSQKELERISETVLNQSEFIVDAMMEDAHDIDEDIKPIVELLNRLGYKVKYSCSGHKRTRISEDRFKDGVYHGKMYTTARITFDKHYNFKNAPEGWYFNKDADTSAIYVRAFTYDTKDGTPDEAFTKWKANYMKALKDWCEHLKESKETNTDAKVESTIAELENEMLSSIPVVESVSADDIFNNTLKSLEEEFGD